MELGLRGKLRYNANGQPENTWNSNGDGTYSFDAGAVPGQSGNTAVWSLEWSINTNFDGSTGFNLSDLTYVLGMDKDPSSGTDYKTLDPIHNILAMDHAFGNNSTPQSGGTYRGTFWGIPSLSSYNNLVNNNNVAQNSWRPSHSIMFGNNFDPTIDGTYTFFLEAFNKQGISLARTEIDIIVGAGAEPPIQDPIPEPATLTLLGLGMAGIAYRRLRNRA